MSLDQITYTQIFISGANSLAPEAKTPDITPVSTADQIAAWMHSSASSNATNRIEATRARNADILNRFLQK